MKNIILYLIPSLIWGSTWLAITFQVGETDASVSVAYRFGLAAVLLLLYARFKNLKLKFTLKEHGYIALQGLLLFSLNYWMVYLAEENLTSGLVALVFSTMLIMNILNSRIFLNNRLPWKVYGGALTGLIGILMIFYKDLLIFSAGSAASWSLVFAFGASYTASLGNIVSARNQTHKLPVLQTNAYGMLYGSAIMLIISFFSGSDFSLNTAPSYVLSLIYLSVFGSVFAFGAYLSLIGRIGAGRAGYVQLLVPIIALLLSSLFEDYRWNAAGIAGVVLILAGNFVVLERRKTRQAPTSP